MLSRACRTFRKGFEPGLGDDPHLRVCPECRTWAEGVAGLRSTGAVLFFPDPLRARLEAIPRERRNDSPEVSDAEPPRPLALLPRMPVPESLAARLRQIPVETRGTGPRWIPRTRDGLAASFLLAFLMLPLLGNPGKLGEEASVLLTRGLGFAVEETGTKGIQALDEAGGYLFQGCELANREMGSLMGRLRSPGPEHSDKKATATPERGNIPPKTKENHDGNRAPH